MDKFVINVISRRNKRIVYDKKVYFLNPNIPLSIEIDKDFLDILKKDTDLVISIEKNKKKGEKSGL